MLAINSPLDSVVPEPFPETLKALMDSQANGTFKSIIASNHFMTPVTLSLLGPYDRVCSSILLDTHAFLRGEAIVARSPQCVNLEFYAWSALSAASSLGQTWMGMLVLVGMFAIVLV